MWIWSKLKYIYNLTYNREKGAYFTNVVLYVHIFKAYEKQCLVEFSNAKSQNLQWQEVNKTHALFALISREKLTAKFSREHKKSQYLRTHSDNPLSNKKWVNEIVNKQLAFVNKQLIICKQTADIIVNKCLHSMYCHRRFVAVPPLASVCIIIVVCCCGPVHMKLLINIGHFFALVCIKNLNIFGRFSSLITHCSLTPQKTNGENSLCRWW